MTQISNCLPRDLFILDTALACVDGALAAIAFIQLIRIHTRNHHHRWTRQQVLHLVVGSSNLGYFAYFTSTLTATCNGWLCWLGACGFFLMAFPKILFLAAFLLLLSFWVDICHQANEEDNDTDDSIQQALMGDSKDLADLAREDGHWRCCTFRFLGIDFGTRQKFMIMVAVVLLVIMMSFAILIGIGAGKFLLEPSTAAEVYENFLAAMMFLTAGALGFYGLLLFLRLRQVRSEQASSEMWKVAGLAILCIICFSSSSLVALFTDVPLFYQCHLKTVYGVKALIYLLLYYALGCSFPSAVLLWIIKDLPPAPATSIPRHEHSRTFTFVSNEIVTQHGQQHWVATATVASSNQGLRASPI